MGKEDIRVGKKTSGVVHLHGRAMPKKKVVHLGGGSPHQVHVINRSNKQYNLEPLSDEDMKQVLKITAIVLGGTFLFVGAMVALVVALDAGGGSYYIEDDYFYIIDDPYVYDYIDIYDYVEYVDYVYYY